MRRMVALLALALFVAPSVLAGPGEGTDLTQASSTWWLHADAESQSAWMSNAKDEGTDHYAGWGPASPTIAPPILLPGVVDFPLVPAPTADILIDTAKSIDMKVWVGGSEGGVVAVTPFLLVDGAVFAQGEELEGYFYNGGLADFTWTLTPQLEVIPAGADVVWRFQISGAHAGAFLWMAGDQWTAVTIPVIDPVAPDNAEPTPGPDAEDPSSTTEPQPTPSPTPSTQPAPTDPIPTASPAAEPTPTPSPAAEQAKGSPGIGILLTIGLVVAVAARRRI